MHIRPAVRSDIPDIADLVQVAFMDDELHLWLHPNQSQEQYLVRERCIITTKRRWNDGLILQVCVTDENDHEWTGREKLVGYAAWEKETGDPDDSSKNKASTLELILFNLERKYDWYFRNNLNDIKSRISTLMGVVSQEQSLNRYERYLLLDMIAVDPSFERRGIAGKLLRWGQDQASKNGVPLLLWSSVKGFGLYQRHGFEVVRELVFSDDLKAPSMAWFPPSFQPTGTLNAA